MSNSTKEDATPTIHGFYNKLRQQSVFDQFIRYVEFQKKIRNNGEPLFSEPDELLLPGKDKESSPRFDCQSTTTTTILTNKQYIGPTAPMSILSINLDITTSCNHQCIFCVDAEIINNEYKVLNSDEVFKTIDILIHNGLRSVILIGGGEPTLHSGFVDIAHYIKSKGLQLGIVSNGTRPQKIRDVVPLMQENDYIRFSIDAGINATYQKIHNPRGKDSSLKDVLCLGKEIKQSNQKISLGYSFVICWEGIISNGKSVPRNIEEIPLAYRNCRDYHFDYLSLKPCLIKEPQNPVETICDDKPGNDLVQVCRDIRKQIRIVENNIDENIPIIQSINLRGMLNGNLNSLRVQPRICHAGFFRQVITPHGIYHCPAYRGSDMAFISDSSGYTSQESANRSYIATTGLLMRFDASKGCKDVACFYNALNHSIQQLIDGNENLNEVESIPDGDFFF
jgi:hypothetical protein